MQKTIYTWIRDLHLYLGLFVSSFVLLFVASAIVLVHPPGRTALAQPLVRSVSDLRIDPSIETFAGRARVNAVRDILDQSGVRGEISFVRHLVNEHRIVAPVDVPGRHTIVDIDLLAHTAIISESKTGIRESIIFLHKSPGPHLADIRMNWLPMRIWRWAADATVYLVLFLSVSGMYLWFVLRSERRAGVVLLLAGAMSFGVIVYALAG